MPKPTIELLYHPNFTMSPGPNGRTAQVVVTLMIGDTHFADVAKVVWAAAARCYLNQVGPSGPDMWQQRQTPIYESSQNKPRALRLGKPFPEAQSEEFRLNGQRIYNGPGLRESLRLRKTLARGTVGSALDGPMIVELLRRNFEFVLRGFELTNANDPTPTIENAGIFPMVPGLVLAKPGIDVDFRTTSMRDSDFEDRFDAALSELWGFAEPSAATSTGERRGLRSFAELAFEQYFDRLLSSANDLFDQGCESWFRTHGGTTRLLGDTLDNPFDDPDGQTIARRFRGLLAQVSADFCSGLRIPEDFDEQTNEAIQPFKGFYEWTGQQFELPPIPEFNPAYPYRIALEPRASSPADWIQIDVAPRDPVTTSLNGVEIASLLRADSFAPTQLENVRTLSPLQASDHRYSFSPALRWQPANAASLRSVWPMPSAMLRAIRDLSRELTRESIRVDCRLEMAGDQNSNDDASSVAMSSARWATIIPLMIRQVADNTKAGGEKVDHLYELVGMSEKDRRLLTSIIEDLPSAGLARIDLLYQVGDEWISDSVSMDPRSTDCLVFRTNLTTESAPENAKALATNPISGMDIASLGSSGEFIRLVQNACIVNSGGYFLRYEPASSSHPENDPLKELFAPGVSQQRHQVLLTFVYGSVANDRSPKAYYNAVESDTPAAQPERDPHAFAYLERKDAGGAWHRLVQHDVRFAPGSVGFCASRVRVPSPPAPNPDPDPVAESAYLLDNLFSRLGYSIATPGVFAGQPTPSEIAELNTGRLPLTLGTSLREYGIQLGDRPDVITTVVDREWKLVDREVPDLELVLRLETADLRVVGIYRHFPMTLPVQPREPGRSFGNNRTVDVGRWHWEHAIQVLRYPFTQPYAGIGQEIHITLAIRDGFGNEFAAEGAAATIRPKLVYYDKLIGLAEWPAAKTELRAIGPHQNPDIVIQISAIPFGIVTIDDDGRRVCTAVSVAEKERVIERYQTIDRQLADPNVEGRVCIYSRPDMASGVPIPIECKRRLQAFVNEVLRLGADPSADPCARVFEQIPFGTPSFGHPDDFFQLQVVLEIVRNAPADHFATVKYPWKSYGPNDPEDVFVPARVASSPVGLPGTAPATGDESPLVRLAEAFQARFPNLLLATVEGDEQDRDLWVVRRDRLVPRIRRYVPPNNGTHLVFAAKPLSTELIWRRITGLPGEVASGGASVAERIFTEVDLDVRTRDCFAAIERFLEPATVASVVKSIDGTGLIQDGWESFQSLMTSKRDLSQLAPQKCLSDLFVNGPSISPCVQNAALAAYRQSVLSKLTGFYEVDGVFPFDVVPPISMTSNRTAGGVALFGKIRDRMEPGILTARTSDSQGTLTMASSIASLHVDSFVDIAWLEGNTNATVYSRNARVVSISGAMIEIEATTPRPLPPQGTSVSVLLVPLSQALNYRNSKIRYFPNSCSNACTLMLVIDQPPATPGIERRQPPPRPLTFQWTHIEFDLPVPTPETGCCRDAEFPTSRWLSLAIPVSIEIDAGRECELLFPVRQFPIAPKVVSHQANPPLSAARIEEAREWEYQLNLSMVMDSVDELEVTAKLNVPLPPVRTAFAGVGQLCDSVMRFQAAFPNPDDSYAVIRARIAAGNVEDGLLIAQELARWAGEIASSFGAVSFAAKQLRTGIEQRDVQYLVHDKYQNPSTDLRESRIQWELGDDDMAAVIRPEHNLQVNVTPISHGNVVTFTETEANTDRPEGWRARRITISNLNALVYESCSSELVLYRNRHIMPIAGADPTDQYLVKPEFVYATPATSTPEPVVALIDVSNQIPLAELQDERTLTERLTSLFARFFAGLDPSADKRRVRCEIKYSFPAYQFADPENSSISWSDEYRIRSAQRLLPPRDIDVTDPTSTVESLVQNLISWKAVFDPDESGALVFDLLAYSILSASDPDRPLVRVRNIYLPIARITRPWS